MLYPKKSLRDRHQELALLGGLKGEKKTNKKVKVGSQKKVKKEKYGKKK